MPGAEQRSTTAGEMAWHAARRRAAAAPCAGRATARRRFLPALPGHTWTNAFGINDDGVVSGWSRKLPSEDGEEQPRDLGRLREGRRPEDRPGPRRRLAEATNRSGLTVGYLGNLGTDGIPGVANTDPERDNAVVWQSRTAAPRLLGRPAPVHFISRARGRQRPRPGRRACPATLTKTGFRAGRAEDLANGLDVPETAPIPAAARKSRVVVTAAERHQQPGRHRGQHLRSHRKGLLQAEPHRPGAVVVRLRQVISPPAMQRAADGGPSVVSSIDPCVSAPRVLTKTATARSSARSAPDRWNPPRRPRRAGP